MDNIGLTCRIINIPLYVSQRKTSVQSSCWPSERLIWTILLPDSVSIYVGVSGSYPIDIVRFYCIIWGIDGTSIWSSSQNHPVTIGSFPYRQFYNNHHHGPYRLNLQHCHSSVSCLPIQEVLYSFPVVIGTSPTEITPPTKLPLLGCNILVFKSPLNIYFSLRLWFFGYKYWNHCCKIKQKAHGSCWR